MQARGHRTLRSLHLRAWVLAAAVLGVTLTGSVAHAQFGPLLNARRAPQAKTQDELDLYLEIYTGGDPRETIRNVERFVEAYPDSEFLGLAYQYQMTAYRGLSDYDGVLTAGAKALEFLPDNLNTLITLATVIPNGADGRPDREELLAKAEGYAAAVLSRLRTLTIPAEIPIEQWESRKAEMEAEAREALGHVAVKKGDLEEALRQFKITVEKSPRPTPSQWYRLGGVYLMTGQQDKAIEPLRRAAETGDGTVKELALDQLERIERSKTK